MNLLYNATNTTAHYCATKSVSKNANTTIPTSYNHDRMPNVELECQARCTSSIDPVALRLVPASLRISQGRTVRRCTVRAAGQRRERLVGIASIQWHQAPVLGRRRSQQEGRAPADISKLVDGKKAVQPAGREGCCERANTYQCVSYDAIKFHMTEQLLNSGSNRPRANDTTSAEPRSPLYLRMGLFIGPHNHQRGFCRLR